MYTVYYESSEQWAEKYKDYYKIAKKVQDPSVSDNDCKDYKLLYNVFRQHFVGNCNSTKYKQAMLCTYLVYTINEISDKLPVEIQFERWQRLRLVDFLICKKPSVIKCYPFECFIIKNKRLPPQSWIDKNFDYKLNCVASMLISQILSLEEIDKFREMVSEKTFNNFIYSVTKQKQYNGQKEIITKYIDVAKEFIVDFYISNKYILDILKQNGWQKREVHHDEWHNRTVFQNLLYYLCFKCEKPNMRQLQEYFYDGCLQQRIKYQDFWLTPAQLYMYKFWIMPPKELQYPEWEKATVDYYGSEINIVQFWIMEVCKPIPQELVYLQDKDEKFVYQTLCYITDEGDYETVNLKGNINDANNYYCNYIDQCKQAYKDYKISDDGICSVCGEDHQKIYNFCDNNHDDNGICLQCFEDMSSEAECPICGDDMIQCSKRCGLYKLV